MKRNVRNENHCSELWPPCWASSKPPPHLNVFVLLGHLLGEQQHGVPGYLGVVEDEAADSGEGFSTPRLKGHSCQRVRAQVEELQVGNVGDDFTDLKTRHNVELRKTV